MFHVRVPGMTCGGCAQAVTRAVQSVDPAATVEVDLRTKQVAVQSAADTVAVTKAIRAAGFAVE